MNKHVDYFLAGLRVSLKNAIAYRANLLAEALGTLLSVFALFAFWSALYANRAEVSGIDVNTMLLYTASSTILNMLLRIGTESQIAGAIYSGNIAMNFLRPISYPVTLLLDTLAQSLVNILTFVLPYAGLTALFFAFRAPPQLHISFAFFVSVAFSILLSFFYQLSFGFLVFWTMELIGIASARKAIMALFSGSLIPLWFFPPVFLKIARCLPFQAMYHTPLSLFIGKLPGVEGWKAVGVQGLWILGFMAFSLLIFRAAFRRVVVHGG